MRNRTARHARDPVLTLILSLAASFPIAGVPIAAAQSSQDMAPRQFEFDLQSDDGPRFSHRLKEAQAKTRLAELRQRFGAQGVATANQDAYDVHHYELDLDLDPVSEILTGVVTVHARVVSGPITTLELNLDSQMTVTAATAGGLAAAWSHPFDLLTVNLDHSYATDEEVEVTVSYNGDPTGGSWGWDSFGGQEMIWTLSEPYGAREWWPCKDQNVDKADSVDVWVTVPDHLQVVSNGLLLSDVDLGATRQFHWKTRYAIAPYLVSLAIHPYSFYNDWYNPIGGGDPMEVQFWVYPSHVGSTQPTYALTVPMIEWFAQGFGEYPFVEEKYGHAEFVWGGGMEHQTCTSMGGWSEDLISHELTHQWWGDLVTCADFTDIWLNEGFATWGEAYWKEHTDGIEMYRLYMNGAAYYGTGTITIEDPSNFGSIFDGNLSYNKASWVVHMLRGVLGDADFFAGLAEYRSRHGYGTATTGDLRDAMEFVSGRDLDTFFQRWIYGDYYPEYRYSWSQEGTTLHLTVEQVQTQTGLFDMPIAVRVMAGPDTLEFQIENSLALQNYELPVTGVVSAVRLDPDGWILKKMDAEMASPTFASGILVVNGVHWDTYGAEITSAYADSAFSGTAPFDFWDTFPEPAGGYSSAVPAPLGHGAVPSDVLGHYSTVIWVGNDYFGDLPEWHSSAIQGYLEAGGNVLLMTRRGSNFVNGPIQNYLDVTWSNIGASFAGADAVYPGLVNMSTSTQTLNDAFFTAVGPDATLLFQVIGGSAPGRGLGVHAQPPGGGSARPDGGHFVYLAGRPYRWSHTALRANVDVILQNLFGEPTPGLVSVPSQEPSPGALFLAPAEPNPSHGSTMLRFTSPRPAKVRLALYDAAGRLVRTLLDANLPGGEHVVDWDGRDRAGQRVAAGAYYLRLESEGTVRSRSLVVIR